MAVSCPVLKISKDGDYNPPGQPVPMFEHILFFFSLFFLYLKQITLFLHVLIVFVFSLGITGKSLALPSFLLPAICLHGYDPL